MSAPGVLIVTGASRGIGAATAKLAASHGWKVCVNYRHRSEQADQVVKDIVQQGGEAIAVQANVSDEQDVARMFDLCEAELGPITALVNNAGIAGGASRVVDLSVSALESLFAINVTGSFICAKEAIKRMSTKQSWPGGGQGGAIVNVSSLATKTGAPGVGVHYAASKGAMDTFTLGLGIEVAAEGIRVNAVSPGLIDTDMHADIGFPDRATQAGPSIPVGRAGNPAEVAEAILWLLSGKSSYVVGAVLDVTGGR